MHEVTEVGEGQSARFDGVWSDALETGVDNRLFTAGPPRRTQALWHIGYVEDLLAELGPTQGSWSVLELGAGRGTTSTHLRHRGHHAVMVDLSVAGFELARRSFAELGIEPARMVCSDATRCGLRDGSFDAVVSIGLLEHFDDPTPVVATALRLLRPGGVLFQVVVPHTRPRSRLVGLALFAPWRLPRALASLWRHRGRTTAHPDEVYRNELQRADYARLTRELGAVDVACVPYNPYWGFHAGAPNRYVELPLYRLHYALRRKLRSRRRLRTTAATGLADLLVARRAATPAG